MTTKKHPSNELFIHCETDERHKMIDPKYTDRPTPMESRFNGTRALGNTEAQFNGTRADDLQIGGDHYKDMGVQPWAVMEAVLTREEFIGFLKGNAIKYAMRQGKKQDSNDTGKAKHYMQKLQEVLHGQR